MNAAVFAEWMRRQGHRVVRTKSSYWYNPAPGVFQAFPYHWVIAPSDEEIRDLMLRHGALAVRYSAPLNHRRGLVSYHISVKEPYSLDQLKAQARNGIRAGLARFHIEQVGFDRLAMEGWPLQRDTLERQGRLRSMPQENWERLCRSACDLPGFEAWAATVGGELAAAVIVARMDSVFSVPFAMSHRKFLGQHVNNALFFTVSKELLGRDTVERLFFTVQSLDAPANVDEFKFRMGFQANLVRQCVDFNPLVRPFATLTVHELARWLLNRDPSNPLLAKAEGMLRFHLEGRKPIEEQDWPERARPEREKLVPKPEPILKTGTFEVVPATAFDTNALVDLHGACFSKHDHIPVQLGRPFILAVYRWFVSSPDNFVLVAKQGDRILGFTALSDRPYNLPMLIACHRELINGYLWHPSAIFNLELFRRLGRILLWGKSLTPPHIAQIAFTGVDPAFQGRGIGKALKAASIQVCRERGMLAVDTGVRRQNERARLLNEHAGFVELPAFSTKRLVYLRLTLRDRTDAP